MPGDSFKNENSQILYGTGAGLVASALPERDRADFANLASGIGQILQNRFLAHQYEDFRNNEMASFMQQTSAFGESLGVIEDPNKRVQAFTDYRNAVMVPFITDITAKYGRNEQIMNVAKSVFEMGPKLKEYMDADQEALKGREMDINQENADTAKQEAQNRAGALKLEMDRNTPIDPNMAPAEILKKLRTMNPEEAQDLDRTTFDMIAQRDAASRSGQFDPLRKQTFGNFMQDTKDEFGNMIVGDVTRSKQVLAETPEKLSRALEFGRGVRKIGYDAMVSKFPGQYTDVIPYWQNTVNTPKPVQMRGRVADMTIAGVLMNRPSDQLPLRPDGQPMQSIDDVIHYIKTSSDPADLGEHFMSAIGGAIKVEGQDHLVDMTGPTPKSLEFSDDDPVGNRNKLRKALLNGAHQMITNELTVNDKDTAMTRAKMDKLIIAAVDQYLPGMADHYGVNIRVRPPKGAAPAPTKGPRPGTVDTKPSVLGRSFFGGIF